MVTSRYPSVPANPNHRIASAQRERSSRGRPNLHPACRLQAVFASAGVPWTGQHGAAEVEQVGAALRSRLARANMDVGFALEARSSLIRWVARVLGEPEAAPSRGQERPLFEGTEIELTAARRFYNPATVAHLTLGEVDLLTIAKEIERAEGRCAGLWAQVDDLRTLPPWAAWRRIHGRNAVRGPLLQRWYDAFVPALLGETRIGQLTEAARREAAAVHESPSFRRLYSHISEGVVDEFVAFRGMRTAGLPRVWKLTGGLAPRGSVMRSGCC